MNYLWKLLKSFEDLILDKLYLKEIHEEKTLSNTLVNWEENQFKNRKDELIEQERVFSQNLNHLKRTKFVKATVKYIVTKRKMLKNSLENFYRYVICLIF